MSEKPSTEETSLWHRRLASQANNRAWSLSEPPSRTPDEEEEMLQAARAAVYFWKLVGNENNKAHAAQLLAHAYATLELPNPAMHSLAKSEPVLSSDKAEPWERALAHAVAANVAAAKGAGALHRSTRQTIPVRNCRANPELLSRSASEHMVARSSSE